MVQYCVTPHDIEADEDTDRQIDCNCQSSSQRESEEGVSPLQEIQQAEKREEKGINLEHDG